MSQGSTAVLGSAGFIGSHLVVRLSASGTDVVALVRPDSDEADFLRAKAGKFVAVESQDIMDVAGLVAQFRSHKIQTVIHLAADNRNDLKGASPYGLFESNIRASYTVFEACRLAGVKKIVSMTSQEADIRYWRQGITVQPYAASKISLEVVARSFRDCYGLPIVLLKPDNVYGGGDANPRRLIPWAIREYLDGRKPSVPAANLSSRRGYVYVDDMVAAILAAAGQQTATPEFIFSVFASETHSVGGVLQEIGRHFGDRSNAEVDAPQARAPRAAGLFEPGPLPGFSLATPFADGLAATVRSYRSSQ